MITRILTLLLLVISFTSSAQLQDKSWHQFSAPGGLGSSVLDRTSSLNILDNGKIYFTYHDNLSGFLNIYRYDVLNQQWNIVQSNFLGTFGIDMVSTYSVGSTLYVAWVETISGSEFNIARLDQNDQFQIVVGSAITNMDSFQNSSLSFSVDEVANKAYTVVKGPNSDVYVDVYNLTSNSFENGSFVGYLSADQPKIALDFSASTIYVVGNDFSQNLLVHSSPFGASLNFTPLGGSGFVYSPLFTNEANSFSFNIIEKANSSPELIFTHFDSGLQADVNVRLGLGTNTNNQLSLTPPNAMFGTSGPARGPSSFLFGHNTASSEIYVEELFADGSTAKVALNQNPIINSIDGEAYKVSHNTIASRLGVFYHSIEGNGTDGGKLAITNSPPQLLTYDSFVGCTGGYSILVKNIEFFDSDNDEVVLLNNFQSTNPTVLDPSSLFAFNSGNGWAFDGFGGSAGLTDITFYYTDGIDTLSEIVTIEVVAPQVPSYLESPLQFCVNQGVVDLNEYVDLSGGQFSFDESNVLENGLLDLSNYDDPAFLPYQSFLDYSYFDQNGCSSFINTDVTILDVPSATLSITNSACGAGTGSIEAQVTSPNGPYFSYWNTGDQDQLLISNLNPGAYYFNVFDDQGCMAVAQGTVEASDISVSAQFTPVSCHNGQDGGIELNISGPGAPYSVFWSTGASTTSIQNLAPGNYEAIVTDVNGCQVTYAYNLVNPPRMTLDLVATLPSSCFTNDGSLESFVNNAVGNVSYQWSTGATSIDLVGLNGGMFSLTVTDENGCTATASRSVVPSTGIFADASVLRTNCGTNDGAIEVNLYPAFGQSVTSIEWSNGATTQNIYNLSPGYYECIATQSDGCQSVFGWNVTTLKPSKPSICMVTVDTVTTTNLIVWEKPVTTTIDHYRIYRESNLAGQFQLIDTVHYSNISVFNDVVASPKTKSWRYKISAVNECGDESALSGTHKTIHLTTQDLGTGEFKVTWDNYEGFPFNEYDLYRYTNATGWELILDNIPFLALPYTFDTPPSIDGLDYMIEIDPGFQCTATFGKAQDYNSSRSNKAKGEFNPGDGTGDPNNSIVELEGETMNVSVYPNPSTGIYNVSLTQTGEVSEVFIHVTDVSGKIVLSQPAHNGISTLDISHVQSGMYFVHFYDGQSSMVVRLIKE